MNGDCSSVLSELRCLQRERLVMGFDTKEGEGEPDCHPAGRKEQEGRHYRVDGRLRRDQIRSASNQRKTKRAGDLADAIGSLCKPDAART